MAGETVPCIRTLRLKVKREGYAWLNAAAIEVNQVWNWVNATSYKVARPFVGPSATIQRINAEYATRRRQFKKLKLRWRVSGGSKRSLGWIPFKAAQLKRRGKCLRFSGKALRVFEPDLLQGCQWGGGCFAQDALGDWWLCLPVERAVAQATATAQAVGIDLGLKSTATTSDGEKLVAGQFYRGIEQKIAMAQRRGHKRQAKRLHRKASRRRRDALHKFSSHLVARYQTICVGDVSSLKLAKTRMAKSVLDAGWGMLKTQLQYKGQQAGRSVIIVDERNTTRACSSCGALTGPSGLDSLVVRSWMCSGCGETHDRDVNAAKNILFAGRCSPSVSGNEPQSSDAPPSPTSRRRKRINALTVAA
jgi:putative transposase